MTQNFINFREETPKPVCFIPNPLALKWTSDSNPSIHKGIAANVRFKLRAIKQPCPFSHSQGTKNADDHPLYRANLG